MIKKILCFSFLVLLTFSCAESSVVTETQPNKTKNTVDNDLVIQSPNSGEDLLPKSNSNSDNDLVIQNNAVSEDLTPGGNSKSELDLLPKSDESSSLSPDVAIPEDKPLKSQKNIESTVPLVENKKTDIQKKSNSTIPTKVKDESSKEIENKNLENAEAIQNDEIENLDASKSIENATETIQDDNQKTESENLNETEKAPTIKVVESTPNKPIQQKSSPLATDSKPISNSEPRKQQLKTNNSVSTIPTKQSSPTIQPTVVNQPKPQTQQPKISSPSNTNYTKPTMDDEFPIPNLDSKHKDNYDYQKLRALFNEKEFDIIERDNFFYVKKKK
jgi:hypothetical protein